MDSPSVFFKELYRSITTGYAEIRLLHHTGDISLAKKIYRPANSIHECNFDYLAEMNAEYHVYQRVNVSMATRSKKADITQAVGLWLEIDSNEADIEERLIEYHFPPTLLIHSGSGYHAYFLFKEPLVIDSEKTRHEYERTLEGMILDWGIEAGGDVHTKDITRILRTPFYRNIKPKYAPDFPECRVVWYDDSIGDRYKFEYFWKRYAPLGTPQAPQVRRELPVLSKGQYPKWIQDYLQHGVGEGNRNKRCYDIARGLWDLGYDELEIVGIVSPRASADGLPQHEISATVHSACGNPRNLSTGLDNTMRKRYIVGDKSKK